MKILITAPGFEEISKIFENIAEVELTFHKMNRIYEEEELIQALNGFDAVIVWIDPMKEKCIEAVKDHIKVIGVPRAGYDNVDINLASKYRIPVIYAPGANAAAVAEYTIGMIYSLSRNMAKANLLLKTNRWNERWAMMVGSELAGKKLGIIGLGNIGCRVALHAKAIGMQVIGYDPQIKEETITSLGMFPKELGIQLSDFDTILKDSDFITIHVPMTKLTFGMIGYKQFCKMKTSSFLINTSRGGIVDEIALYRAIKEGKIAGAALDVFENEPIDQKNPLLGLDNVIVTPHIAWCTKDAIIRVNSIIANEIKKVLERKKPSARYLANPQVLFNAIE